MPTLNISSGLKSKLDSLKDHRRDTYGDVIERLIRFYENNRYNESVVKDSLYDHSNPSYSEPKLIKPNTLNSTPSESSTSRTPNES